jgi:PAS domain-containing protein
MMFERPGKGVRLKPGEPLVLHHSWPLFEQSRHFELGQLFNCTISEITGSIEAGWVGPHHAGCWECDLSDNKLDWSGGVYDIFGLPRGAPVTRDEAVALYAEESRAAMERLRAHAIKHRRGFTLDARIRPAVGQPRWMRLIAVPRCVEGRAVSLQGVKLII